MESNTLTEGQGSCDLREDTSPPPPDCGRTASKGGDHTLSVSVGCLRPLRRSHPSVERRGREKMRKCAGDVRSPASPEREPGTSRETGVPGLGRDVGLGLGRLTLESETATRGLLGGHRASRGRGSPRTKLEVFEPQMTVTE